MGRTWRRRLLKKNRTIVNYCNNDPAIIELNRWLKNKLWYNETKLKIASFSNTGRGVMATKNVDCGDIIIEFPYELMITYTILENCENFKSFIAGSNEKFFIHELLSLYLLLEYHVETQSSWNSYLSSLPKMNELAVIWLSTEQELGYINEELLIMVKEERNKFEESWTRVKSLLKSQYTCGHCNARATQILKRDNYTWAYILVHTRCVYLDPVKVRAASNGSLINYLFDDPSMGLCPFLDMFNHNYNTSTQAYLSDLNGILNYFLVTGSKFKKYEQIFISYGAHDNRRLVSQYGFILPKNEFDTVDFSLKSILLILKLSANSKQYKFIKDRQLDKLLCLSYIGCSFNMAAVLFILTNQNEIDWTVKIYSCEYTTEQLCCIYKLAKQLLEYKLETYNNEFKQIHFNNRTMSRHFELYLKYLDSRVNFVKEVLNSIVNQYVL